MKGRRRGRPYSSRSAEEGWEQQARLAAGGLLATGYRRAVLPAGHGLDTQVFSSSFVQWAVLVSPRFWRPG